MAYLTNSVWILRKHRRRILDGEWPTFAGSTTLWTWGYNYSGQLGDGTAVSKSSPIQIPGVNWVNWVNVSAGGVSHTRFQTIKITQDQQPKNVR